MSMRADIVPEATFRDYALKTYTIYNGYWFWGWPSTAELWQDLRAVSRRDRPNGDLSAPALGENWEGRDKSLLWPDGGSHF